MCAGIEGKEAFICPPQCNALLMDCWLPLRKTMCIFFCASFVRAWSSILSHAGTSLPDTFASRMAAIHDDTADAAVSLRACAKRAKLGALLSGAPASRIKATI